MLTRNVPFSFPHGLTSVRSFDYWKTSRHSRLSFPVFSRILFIDWARRGRRYAKKRWGNIGGESRNLISCDTASQADGTMPVRAFGKEEVNLFSLILILKGMKWARKIFPEKTARSLALWRGEIIILNWENLNLNWKCWVAWKAGEEHTKFSLSLIFHFHRLSGDFGDCLFEVSTV